jgi:ComF family protein
LPSQCRLCQETLRGISWAPICDSFLASARPSRAANFCERCGLPFETNAPLHGGLACALCRADPPAFDAARSGGIFDGDYRRLIHFLKYDGMRPLARPLAAWTAEVLPELGDVDLLLPVPLHWSRRVKRGFNQAELFAKELSKITGVPADGRALRRTRPTPSQAGLSRRQRRENLRGVFEVKDAVRVRGRSVAVIDDVMTTGTTVAACAQVLKKAGAGRVTALTAARVKRRVLEWNDSH